MDLPEGMVAMVHGLPESALAVTLLDGNRQYTLMPNNDGQPPAYYETQKPNQYDSQKPVQYNYQKPVQYKFQKPVQYISKGVSQDKDYGIHSGIQAIDGRYASVYQVAHCKVQPTSPPVQLTEFPPQRPVLCRGHGNFEVGGLGSGETKYSPVRTNGSYRGGMSWPEPGAVCSPRPSHEPDAFAQSLRKYPHLSPERTAEVMERLINYTQSRNKPLTRQCSPVRSESNYTGQGCDRKYCGSTTRAQKLHEAKIPDESPTRDTSRNHGNFETFEHKAAFKKNEEIRFLREVANKIKEGTRNAAAYPYSFPVSPCLKETYDHLSPQERRVPDTFMMRTNSVNMETQAEVPMVSREVATVPRKQPSTRSVAVLQSSSSFQLESPQQSTAEPKHECSSKSIQTTEAVDLTVKIKISAQTCVSSIDLPLEKKKGVENCRKSKSQDELRRNNDEDIHKEGIQVIKVANNYPDTESRLNFKNGLLRKLKKIHKTERSDRVKIKFGKCIRNQMSSQVNFKSFTSELSNELITKIKSQNLLISGRSAKETDMNKNCNDSTVDELIKEWLNLIPMKKQDYLGRPVKKEHILHTVANKIKSIIIDKEQKEINSSLKPEIFDILEDIPIEVNARSKTYFLNKIINYLVTEFGNIRVNNVTDRKRWTKDVDVDKVLKRNFRKTSFICTHIQPTEEELKEFVKKELNNFTTKFSLKICPATQNELQVELTDILIDSIEAVRYGNDEQLKEEVFIVLSELVNVSHREATHFVNTLVSNIKHIFKETLADNNSQTLILLKDAAQNHVQNFTAKGSTEKITDRDRQNSIDLYNQLIVQEISEWMLSLRGLRDVDAGCLQVAANGLAEDIVDRHKYFEQNPNNKVTDVDETESIKNLIIKWIKKFLAENNLETIEKAPELIERVRKIPVPILTKPIQNVDDSRPLYDQQNAGPKMDASQQTSKPKTHPITRLKSLSAVSAEVVNTCTVGCQKNQESKKSRPVSEPRRVSFTQSTNTTVVEPSRNRRFSGPASFLFGKTPEAGPSNANPDQTDTGRRSSSPAKASQSNNQNDTTAMTTGPSIKQLNNEYDEFLKNWVRQIPIPPSNPEEAAQVEKMRQGIYNGVWKAIAKLKTDPAVVNNPFYYQDLMDEELEELLGLLPQTPELASKKQMLKSQLIEKTTDMNARILNSAPPSSFKEQLIKNISNNLNDQYTDVTDQDIHKACEELQKLSLAEDFILFSKYRENDNVKANVYKRKLLKHIQELFDDLKTGHGKEMIDIDLGKFTGDIVNSLHNVPLPSDDTLKAEADEILIALEIDQWFTDLPLNPPANRVEELTRVKNREVLASRIHNMDKQIGLANCEPKLRQEIMNFMNRIQLSPEEAEKAPFMVEELVNRLRNRPRDIVAGSGVPNQPLNLTYPNDYDDFSRDMQLCSSFSDSPDAKRAQIDQSSYYIINGQRVDGSAHPNVDQYAQSMPHETIPSDQYFTIESEGPIPPQQFSSPRVPRNQASMRQPDSQGMQGISQNPGSQMWNDPNFRDESFRGQMPPDLSFRDPVSDARAQQRSMRQSPQGSRYPDANGTSSYPGERTILDQSSSDLQGPGGYQQDPNTSADIPGQRYPGFRGPRRFQGDPYATKNFPGKRSPGFREPGDFPGTIQRELDISGALPSHRIAPGQRSPGLRGAGGFQEDPNMSGGFPGQTIAPGQRSIGSRGPGEFQRDPDMSGGFFNQSTALGQRSPGFRTPGHIQGDPNLSRGYPEQRSVPDQTPPGFRRAGGFQKDPNIFGGFPSQRTVPGPRSPGFRTPGGIQEDPNLFHTYPDQRNVSSRGSSGLRGPGVLGHIPEDPTRFSTGYRPAGYSRPYEAGYGPDRSRPDSQATGPSDRGQLHATGRDCSPSTGAFSSRPLGFSTPQNNSPSQRDSRPQMRVPQGERSRRDGARKRLPLEDSNESGKEEVRCRCMERIWSRRRRQNCCCCEDDMDFAECFPMGCQFPYYF